MNDFRISGFKINRLFYPEEELDGRDIRLEVDISSGGFSGEMRNLAPNRNQTENRVMRSVSAWRFILEELFTKTRWLMQRATFECMPALRDSFVKRFFMHIQGSGRTIYVARFEMLKERHLLELAPSQVFDIYI
jgi:hypothetical protein